MWQVFYLEGRLEQILFLFRVECKVWDSIYYDFF